MRLILGWPCDPSLARESPASLCHLTDSVSPSIFRLGKITEYPGWVPSSLGARWCSAELGGGICPNEVNSDQGEQVMGKSQTEPAVLSSFLSWMTVKGSSPLQFFGEVPCAEQTCLLGYLLCPFSACHEVASRVIMSCATLFSFLSSPSPRPFFLPLSTPA